MIRACSSRFGQSVVGVRRVINGDICELRTIVGTIPCRSIWAEGVDSDATEKASNFYDSTVEQYASEPIERMSLQQMLSEGLRVHEDSTYILEHGRYVQRELPKRLARRLLDLQFLPYIVVTNPHIKRVYNAYYSAFMKLIKWEELTTMQQNVHFTQLVKRLVDEHTPLLDALANGVHECRNRKFVGKHLQLDSFLDSMLRSRISRRVIAEHYINLHNKRNGFIGCVRTHINVKEAVEHASHRARLVCSETYGEGPPVQLTGDLNVAMPYVPVHLDYMLYELFKNSMRAVVEQHRKYASFRFSPMPVIQVRIGEAPTEVTIRISDKGGGISFEDLQKVWQYGYTTLVGGIADFETGIMAGASGLGNAQYRMGGLGFGLPFSRLHARYFGGDLQLVSMPGYGVDAYLRLRKLEDHDWMETVEDDRNHAHDKIAAV